MLPIFADGEAGAAIGVSIALIVFLCFLGFMVEMLPTWIAWYRGHPSVVSIAIINFFFSWTVIGWIICLAWSFAGIEERRDVHVHVGRRRGRREYDDD